MVAHNGGAQNANYTTFRDCFTSCIGQSLAIPARKPARRKNDRVHGRKKSASQLVAGDETDEPVDADLTDFLEVLATLRHLTLT